MALTKSKISGRHNPDEVRSPAASPGEQSVSKLEVSSAEK